MSISIAYSTLTGNTKILADEIYETVNKNDCIYFGKINEDKENVSLNGDIIFVGFWVNEGTCDGDTKRYLSKIKDKKIFLFGTAGANNETQYYERLYNNIKTNIDKTNNVIEVFMCQGKMPIEEKDKYIQMQQENPNDENIKKMIENFDNALSHPNKKDLDSLKNRVLKCVN